MKFILAVAVWSVAPLLARVQPEAGGNLLLRDYKPRTALVVKQTTIQHAKYPVIDVHPWSRTWFSVFLGSVGNK